ncbi:MAG: hypothetical protein ACE5MH_04425 [Terriglobia bacterium]
MREVRERLGISTTEVEECSQRLAETEGNKDFLVSTARLAQIENEGSVPSVFKLYSLSVIYRVRFPDLLRLFGLDLGKIPAHLRLFQPTETRPVQVELLEGNSVVSFPVRFDPSFDRRATQFLNFVVETWGEIPLAFLQRLNPFERLYGYVGLNDRTMYPLIRPGSFVLIDDARQEVVQTGWTNEFDRPIYFVELRRGYRCCWCQLEGTSLILVPYPLSGCKIETLTHPDEAEVIGQVTGVAMRIVEPEKESGHGKREPTRLP